MTRTADVAVAARITVAEQALSFALGGKAHFTIVSPRTGTRFTYKVTAADKGDAWFAAVLSGPQNETDYSYMGLVTADKMLRATRATRMDASAPSWRALTWLLQQLRAGKLDCEFWHAGRCCCCGRLLTDPESIESGIGPKCAGRGAAGRHARRAAVSGEFVA